MSFIYKDHDLMQQLFKIAVPTKTAQTAPAAPVDPNTIKNVATKMVNNLERDANLGTDRGDAAVFMRDLQDLNSFVSFLKLENISYNGSWLVVDNYNALDADKKKLYVPYRWQGGLDAFPTNTVIGIYKDGLIAYLKTLQQHANTTGGIAGQLLSTLLNKLMNQANAELKMGLKSEDIHTQEVGNQAQPMLLDTTIVDSVNETIVVENPLSPQRDKGPILVVAKDLKNKMNFDGFIRQLKVSKGGKIINYEDFTDSNYCDIIRTLYARASSYVYRRGANLDKGYLQLITELAALYDCNVKGTGAGNGAGGENVQVSYHPGGGGNAQLSGSAQKAAMALAMKMPLLGDRIDFPRIRNWLQAYLSIGEQVNMDAGTRTAIGHVEQLLDTVANTYRIPSQSLAQEATAVASTVIMSTLGTPAAKAGAPVAYLHVLQQLMSLVGTILSAFKNNVYDSLPQDYKDEIDEQIGSGGSSFYNINTDKIETWLLDLPGALQTIKSQGF